MRFLPPPLDLHVTPYVSLEVGVGLSPPFFGSVRPRLFRLTLTSPLDPPSHPDGHYKDQHKINERDLKW